MPGLNVGNYKTKNREMNNVTICKKDTCLSVKGGFADFISIAIGVAILGYGVSLIAKALR